MAIKVHSSERVSSLAGVLTSMFYFSLSPSPIMFISLSQSSSLNNSCTHFRFLFCLSLARFCRARAYWELGYETELEECRMFFVGAQSGCVSS